MQLPEKVNVRPLMWPVQLGLLMLADLVVSKVTVAERVVEFPAKSVSVTVTVLLSSPPVNATLLKLNALALQATVWPVTSPESTTLSPDSQLPEMTFPALEASTNTCPETLEARAKVGATVSRVRLRLAVEDVFPAASV